MVPTSQLSDLLCLARRRMRLRSARWWMMVTMFGLSGVALASPLVDLPYAGLALLPAVPLAGIIGYLRGGAGDGSLAQRLDSEWRTSDLLASAVACRGKDDEASRTVTAHAEAYAADVDRQTLRSPAAATRPEAAACLLLVLALTVSLAVHGPRTLTQDNRTAADSPLATVREGEPARSDAEARSVVRRLAGGDPEASVEEEMGRGRGGDTSLGLRDASGDGLSETASRLAGILPPARGGESETPAAKGTRSASGGSGRNDAVSGSSAPAGMAQREPIAAGPALPAIARERARQALDARRIDFDSRDLLLGYFDLDSPR